MNNRLYFVLSSGTIILLSLMVIMGTIQVIENTRKYGYSYDVITIIEGKETRTTMTVWVNVAFLVFLSMIVYLLSVPLTYYYKNIKKKEDDGNG